jgi:hypothetical protein
VHSSNEIDKLAQALVKAQGVMENAEEDAENPHFRSKFASLASVRRAVRKPLADNGLAYVQTVRYAEGVVEVETRLLHESGQWLGDTLPVPCPQATAQAVGSAISYGRRYSLMAITGIAPEEDDGEAAQPARERPASLKPALSPVEVQTLADLLDRKGFSPTQVCRKYGVGALRELTREQYDDALATARAKPDPVKPDPKASKPPDREAAHA